MHPNYFKTSIYDDEAHHEDENYESSHDQPGSRHNENLLSIESNKNNGSDTVIDSLASSDEIGILSQEIQIKKKEKNKDYS